jgi:methylenetetrahydrofolate reductase (NADPH)
MLLGTFGGFQRMIGICKTRVPKDLLLAAEKVKDNEIEFKRFGVELGITMTKSLMEIDDKVSGLHFYTLNSSSATLDILKAIGITR